MIFRYLAGLLCFHLLFLWKYNQICPCCLWSVPGLGPVPLQFSASGPHKPLSRTRSEPLPQSPRMLHPHLLHQQQHSAQLLERLKQQTHLGKVRSSLYSRTAIMPWLLTYQKQISLDVCSQDRNLIYFTSLVQTAFIWNAVKIRFGVFVQFKMWNVIQVCGCVSWMDLCLCPRSSCRSPARSLVSGRSRQRTWTPRIRQRATPIRTGWGRSLRESWRIKRSNSTCSTPSFSTRLNTNHQTWSKHAGEE